MSEEIGCYVKFKQNAKRQWYCDGLMVSDKKDIDVALAKADKIIESINNVSEKYNKELKKALQKISKDARDF